MANVVTVGWGTYLNAALNILQQGWFEQKFLGEHPFCYRCWYGVNQMMIHFSKHPFRQVAIILFILFFKPSWWNIASAARNWIDSFPQTAATTFASSVFILLLCMTSAHLTMTLQCVFLARIQGDFKGTLQQHVLSRNKLVLSS